MKPISIQLYTVRELAKDGNHLDVLQQIANIGYTGVEGSGYGLSDKEFRGVVEDMGMVVSSTWGGIEQDQLQKSIDACGDLGTNYLVVGFWIPEFETLDAIKKTADKINAALPTLQKAGITLCMHNHWMEFESIDGRLKVDYLLEYAPGINLELDIYWCSNFKANKPEEMAAKYRDHVALAHVKDGSQLQGEPMVAVGTGTVDIKSTLANLDDSKLGWHIVELDECATPMMKAVEDSYKYLVGEGISQGRK